MNYKLSLVVFLVALATLACGPAANSPAASPGSDTGSAVLPDTVPPLSGSQVGDGVLPATAPSPTSPESGAAVLPVEPPAALPSLRTEFPTIAPTPDLPATRAALEAIDAHRRQVELATRTAIEAQQEAERYAAALEATRVAELLTPTPLPTATPYPTPIPQPTYPPQPTQTPKVPYPTILERTVSRETFERFERTCLNGKLWQDPFPEGNLSSPAGDGRDFTRELIASRSVRIGDDKSQMSIPFATNTSLSYEPSGRSRMQFNLPTLTCIEVSRGYILDFEFDCDSYYLACRRNEPNPIHLTGPDNYFRLVVIYVDYPRYQIREGTWKMRYTCIERPCTETVARMLTLVPHWD